MLCPNWICSFSEICKGGTPLLDYYYYSRRIRKWLPKTSFGVLYFTQIYSVSNKSSLQAVTQLGRVELIQSVEQYYTCLQGLIALFCINQSQRVSNLSRSAKPIVRPAIDFPVVPYLVFAIVFHHTIMWWPFEMVPPFENHFLWAQMCIISLDYHFCIFVLP